MEKLEINKDLNKELDNNNKTIIKIFNLIKLQDWKNLEKLIKENNIDYNIKDTSGIYLLEYALLFNQKEIIRLLISKDTRIDITIDNDRSILYNVIKFSYLDILKLLLEKNTKNIGKSILDIKDRDEDIPLFYAIKFFNIEALKLIIQYTDNFFIKNKEGLNALHLSIQSQNLEIFKLIYEKNNQIKNRNNKGENSLHLIIKYKCYDMLQHILSTLNKNIVLESLNMVEFKYNFSCLHYISINIDLNFIEMLNNEKLIKELNGNIQDNSGNIFYHYFLNNILDISKIDDEESRKLIKFNDYCKDIVFNFNLYNIDGNTPAHILVNNINYFEKNKLNIIINYVLTNSNLNIQNFSGESVFLLLVMKEKWKDFKNILINKKLDIFIFSNNNNTFFDYIKTSELDEFIDMITKSYLNQLTNSDKHFYDYWDNRCKKNVTLEQLNETEIELLKSFTNVNKNMKDNKDNKDNNTKETKEKDNNVCYTIIYNKIKNYIENFIKYKNRYDVNSYPITKKSIKLIDNYPNVNISTFTGSTLDVISGLFYLSEKFNNKTELLETSLKLLDMSRPIINCTFVDVQTKSKVCEISGFEILWKNQMLYIPSNKSNDLVRLINDINMRKKVGIRFLLIPIGIEQINESIIYSHANYLIFDFELMEVERFEPHGSDHPVGFDYNPKLLDKELENKINLVSNLSFKYFSPKTYLSKIGFQTKEISELKNDYIGDPNGFCALWCIWWADLRISNSSISREKLYKKLMTELINENYSFKKLIRDYSFYVNEIRDGLLTKANTNINEWINDTIPQHNVDLLNNLLIERIKKINEK